MARRKGDRSPFLGFDRPESNYFRMPNSWTDITAEIDNIAELKVVEYILRHTWGYQEYGIKKHITIDEFVNGRRRQDGRRMDKGTGLSERAVYDGLRKAVANGLIEEEIDDSDRGRVKKFYSLRMRENLGHDEELQTLQSGMQTLHPPLQTLHPGPQTLQGRGANDAPRSEKDTLERQGIISNFEGAHDQLESEKTGPARRGLAAPAAGDGQSRRRGTGDTGLKPLGEILSQRATATLQVGAGADSAPAGTEQEAVQPSAAPRRRRPTGDPEERERLRAFLEDFARELGDEAPLASTITRTLNIFTAADVPPERWGDALYQARDLTQEHTAQIRKLAGNNGSGLRRKNKMPYFLATLEQLVGLRPEPPRDAAGSPPARGSGTDDISQNTQSGRGRGAYRA